MNIIRLAATAGFFLTILQSTAQVNITQGGTATQSFDDLGTAGGAWADNATLSGWYAARSNNTAGVVLQTGNYAASSGGSPSSTTLYSLGSSGSSERALGGMPALTSKWLFGWRLLNSGATPITNLVVTYDGEQWRQDTTVNHRINVSYQVFAAEAGSLSVLDGWAEAPESLTFIAPTTGTLGAIDGNAADNRAAGLTGLITGFDLQPGQEMWLRWTFIKGGGPNLQLGIDNATATVPVGQPPVIGAIPNISVKAGATSVTNAFTVNDLEDDAASIALPTPTATSSQEAVVPAANIFFEGTGSERTVHVIAGSTLGTTDIIVSIQDSNGNVGQQTFTVTVLASDLAPSISAPGYTNTLVNTSVTVPFTVEDPETAASSLTVTGTIASYSSAILASLEINSDASGTNRTVTLTPVAGATGVGIVTLSVDDAVNTSVTSFAVMVKPDANTVLIDHFDYPPSTAIDASSPGFWTRRNSSAQSVGFLTSSDTQAWIQPRSGADDASVPLADGPYTPGSGVVLFTMFKAQWNDLGNAVGDSSGAFILLAPNAGATSDQLMQVATRTNGVPEGFFRLLLSNGENIYSEYSNADLSLGGVYSIVVRYDVDTAKSTLWVNGTSETSPGVSATDDQAPANVGFVSIRQEPGMGDIYLDDLEVVAIYKPAISTLTPPAGGNVEIFFSAGAGDVIEDFEVERATTLDGGFSGVAATFTSLGDGNFKATAPSSGDQSFYRLKRKPFVF